jgi:hypothetical protein
VRRGQCRSRSGVAPRSAWYAATNAPATDPAAVSVWSGWVGLGQLTGFGTIHPLPGFWNTLTINIAVVLPLSVEAYGAYALRCWLTTAHYPHAPATSPAAPPSPASPSERYPKSYSTY